MFWKRRQRRTTQEDAEENNVRAILAVETKDVSAKNENGLSEEELRRTCREIGKLSEKTRDRQELVRRLSYVLKDLAIEDEQGDREEPKLEHLGRLTRSSSTPEYLGNSYSSESSSSSNINTQLHTSRSTRSLVRHKSAGRQRSRTSSSSSSKFEVRFEQVKAMSPQPSPHHKINPFSSTASAMNSSASASTLNSLSSNSPVPSPLNAGGMSPHHGGYPLAFQSPRPARMGARHSPSGTSTFSTCGASSSWISPKSEWSEATTTCPEDSTNVSPQSNVSSFWASPEANLPLQDCAHFTLMDRCSSMGLRAHGSQKQLVKRILEHEHEWSSFAQLCGTLRRLFIPSPESGANGSVKRGEEEEGEEEGVVVKEEEEEEEEGGRDDRQGNKECDRVFEKQRQDNKAANQYIVWTTKKDSPMEFSQHPTSSSRTVMVKRSDIDIAATFGSKAAAEAFAAEMFLMRLAEAVDVSSVQPSPTHEQKVGFSSSIFPLGMQEGVFFRVHFTKSNQGYWGVGVCPHDMLLSLDKSARSFVPSPPNHQNTRPPLSRHSSLGLQGQYKFQQRPLLSRRVSDGQISPLSKTAQVGNGPDNPQQLSKRRTSCM